MPKRDLSDLDDSKDFSPSKYGVRRRPPNFLIIGGTITLVVLVIFGCVLTRYVFFAEEYQPTLSSVSVIPTTSAQASTLKPNLLTPTIEPLSATATASFLLNMLNPDSQKLEDLETSSLAFNDLAPRARDDVLIQLRILYDGKTPVFLRVRRAGTISWRVKDDISFILFNAHNIKSEPTCRKTGQYKDCQYLASDKDVSPSINWQLQLANPSQSTTEIVIFYPSTLNSAASDVPELLGPKDFIRYIFSSPALSGIFQAKWGINPASNVMLTISHYDAKGVHIGSVSTTSNTGSSSIRHLIEPKEQSGFWSLTLLNIGTAKANGQLDILYP